MTKAELTSTDFVTLLKRAKKIHDLITREYPDPKDAGLNLMSMLFCYLLFNSGLVPLGQILANTGNLHDAIMMSRGTNELDKLLDELKQEEEEKKH